MALHTFPHDAVRILANEAADTGRNGTVLGAGVVLELTGGLVEIVERAVNTIAEPDAVVACDKHVMCADRSVEMRHERVAGNFSGARIETAQGAVGSAVVSKPNETFVIDNGIVGSSRFVARRSALGPISAVVSHEIIGEMTGRNIEFGDNDLDWLRR